MKSSSLRLSQPTFKKELALLKQGFSFVAGIDEAGRGAWAGPVVAAAVIFPVNSPTLPEALHIVRDSKLMTARQREAAFEIILASARAVGVGISSPKYIERTNIVAATRRAMTFAIRKLMPHPDYLLIDAVPLADVSIPQKAFYKAESISLSVAAASIVAKVTRDRLMVQLAKRYPQYGFERHKGYGTKQHRQALAQFGPAKVHRFSFAPIKNLLESTEKSAGS